MNEAAASLWARALASLRSAAVLVDVDPNSAASRAYYAAFQAASAMFALRGKQFRKHAAVEAAIHRDMIRPGHWEEPLGHAYRKLLQMRDAGDYGMSQMVSAEDARDAVQLAERIITAVRETAPEFQSP